MSDTTPLSTLGSASGANMRLRIAILLAAIAVPAMAAPGDFGALPGDAPREGESVNARLAEQIAAHPPMLFEQPGNSFPGSAYYFLDDRGDGALIALPTLDTRKTGAEYGRELGALIDAGPAASPFFSSSAGPSHLRARQCLAQAIWYEAASEREAGQRAVAQVVLNRVTHPDWPDSVCGVVYQGSHRDTGCQFSFTCDGSLARRPGGASWQRAERLAGEALSGSTYAPIGHATHYHTLWVHPVWADRLDPIGTIGAHRFYRNRGMSGEKSAFSVAYSGFEPEAGASYRAAPRPSLDRASADVSTANSPDVSPPSDSAPRGDVRAGPAQPAPFVPPVLIQPDHAETGRVRDDYANAGQWKSDAAREAMIADERRLAREATQPSDNTD